METHNLMEARVYSITLTMSLQNWVHEKNEVRITTVKKLHTAKEIPTISPVSKLRKKTLKKLK